MARSIQDRLGSTVAFFVAILFNFLANALPLGGKTTGEISDRYESLFTPAGFTFAIWGIIYLGLTAFIVRQWFVRASDPYALSKIKTPFLVNCLANAGWIVAWHYDQLFLSMGIMLVILWTLIQINTLISRDASLRGGTDYVLIALPFSIYFGWISVATIANVSVIQSAYGWNDVLLSEQTWTILKLLIASYFGYKWGWKARRPAFLLVITWASFGVSVANSDESVIRAFAQILSVSAFLTAAVAGWKRVIESRLS